MAVYYWNPSIREVGRPGVQGQEEQDKKGGERQAQLDHHSLAVRGGVQQGPEGTISAILCAWALPQNNVVTNVFAVR